MALNIVEAAEEVMKDHRPGTFCCSADRGPCSAIDSSECGKLSCRVCADEPWRNAMAIWPCAPVLLARAALPQPLSLSGMPVGWDGPQAEDIRAILGVDRTGPTVRRKDPKENYVRVTPPQDSEADFTAMLTEVGYLVEATGDELFVFMPPHGS